MDKDLFETLAKSLVRTDTGETGINIYLFNTTICPERVISCTNSDYKGMILQAFEKCDNYVLKMVNTLDPDCFYLTDENGDLLTDENNKIIKFC